MVGNWNKHKPLCHQHVTSDVIFGIVSIKQKDAFLQLFLFNKMILLYLSSIFLNKIEFVHVL